jgi:hypothetical protein
LITHICHFFTFESYDSIFSWRLANQQIGNNSLSSRHISRVFRFGCPANQDDFLRDILTLRMPRSIDTPAEGRIMKPLGLSRQRI